MLQILFKKEKKINLRVIEGNNRNMKVFFRNT
jgi:hypothetical protein